MTTNILLHLNIRDSLVVGSFACIGRILHALHAVEAASTEHWQRPFIAWSIKCRYASLCVCMET